MVVAAVRWSTRDFVLPRVQPELFAGGGGCVRDLLGALLLSYAVALTSVVALRMVGVVLVAACSVIPGSTTCLITDRFVPMLAVSVGSPWLLTGLCRASYYGRIPVVPWSSRRAYCSPWHVRVRPRYGLLGGMRARRLALLQQKLSRQPREAH